MARHNLIGVSVVLLIVGIGLAYHFSLIFFLLLGFPGIGLLIWGLIKKAPPRPVLPARAPLRVSRRRSEPATTPPPPAPPADEPPRIWSGVIKPLISSLEASPAGRPESATPYFAGPGTTVEVGGYVLRDPLIYVADTDIVANYDASLLCLRRRIAPPKQEPPKSLGYWPQLEEVEPYQVGNYVHWLANGKSDPDVDLGYVFLFFYGLERRTLIDGQDIIPICQELVRLLGIYGYSGSFKGYATGLLTHLVMIGRLRPTKKLIEKLLGHQREYITDDLQTLILGHLAHEKEALPSDWGMRLAASDTRGRKSIVIKRAPDEFASLFRSKYQAQFGSGPIPEPGGRETVLHYRPASPTLLPRTYGYERIPVAKWTSVKGWAKIVTQIAGIWNECIEELRSYAKKAHSKGADSAVAYEALPDVLKEEVDHPHQDEWNAVLAQHAKDEGPLLLPVGKIAEILGFKRRPRLTVKMSRDVAEFAEGMGSPLEPDARYVNKGYPWSAHVAALKLPEEPALPQGKSYLFSSLILRLALEIARADGEVDEDERRAISEFLGERFMLGWNDRIRLNGLLEVLLLDEGSLSGLKKKLASQFTENQRQAVGRFLVTIAAASEGVVEKETEALERTFRSLDIDPGLVQAYLAELGLAAPEKPVLAATAEPETGGETIPPPSAEPRTDKEAIPSPPALDLNRIRALRKESDAVAKMLVEAMEQAHIEEDDTEEDEPEDEEQPAAQPPESTSTPTTPPPPPSPPGEVPAASDGLEALRPDFHTLLKDLLKRDEWPRRDFDALARSHGTTASAAIDELNAWSDEHLGDFLLNGDDPVIVTAEFKSRLGASK